MRSTNEIFLFTGLKVGMSYDVLVVRTLYNVISWMLLVKNQCPVFVTV